MKDTDKALIERVAGAMWAAIRPAGGPHWEQLSEKKEWTIKQEFRLQAEAAVKEIGGNYSERDSFVAPLRAIIPPTYGDAVMAGLQLGDLEPHDWDNKTTEEQAAFLIGHYQREITAACADLEASESSFYSGMEKLRALAGRVRLRDVTDPYCGWERP